MSSADIVTDTFRTSCVIAWCLLQVSQYLPSHILCWELNLEPVGQIHVKDPLVFLHCPPSHSLGVSAHSFISAYYKTKTFNIFYAYFPCTPVLYYYNLYICSKHKTKDRVFFKWFQWMQSILPDNIATDKVFFFHPKNPDIFLISPRKHVVVLIRSASVRRF